MNAFFSDIGQLERPSTSAYYPHGRVRGLHGIVIGKRRGVTVNDTVIQMQRRCGQNTLRWPK